MGWGGGWRAITFLGTCTHVMCYVMGFWVVRLMLTCAWGGTSREMFNVPGCPDAEKKGDQAMRCSLWLTSQFEQRSICVFSSYYIYICIYIYIFIYLSLYYHRYISTIHEEKLATLCPFSISSIFWWPSAKIAEGLLARVYDLTDRFWLPRCIHFFGGGRFGVPLLEAYINMIYLRPVCVRCSGISFGSTLFDLFGVNPIDTYMFDHFWLNCAGNRSQIVVFQVGTIPVIWLSNRFISCLNRPHHPHFFKMNYNDLPATSLEWWLRQAQATPREAEWSRHQIHWKRWCLKAYIWISYVYVK